MSDLKAFLRQLKKNRNTLREREAKYGRNVPLEILNQLEDHDRAVALTEQAIAGDLSETEWREVLKPLNVDHPDEAASSTTFNIETPNAQIGAMGENITIEGGVHFHPPAPTETAPVFLSKLRLWWAKLKLRGKGIRMTDSTAIGSDIDIDTGE